MLTIAFDRVKVIMVILQRLTMTTMTVISMLRANHLKSMNGLVKHESEQRAFYKVDSRLQVNFIHRITSFQPWNQRPLANFYLIFDPGLQTTNTSQTNQRAHDEDEDLNVDGDDTHVYGQSQYSERDIILVDANKQENVYLRNLVIGENAASQPFSQQSTTTGNGTNHNNETEASTSGFMTNASVAQTEITCESTASSSRITIDLKDGSVSEVTTVTGNQQIATQQNDTSTAQVIEALKAKIREYENTIRNKSKCLICIDEFRVPVVSICCWHVHCEECWLRTLGARKLCPQCNMITSPADLRRIYM